MTVQEESCKSLRNRRSGLLQLYRTSQIRREYGMENEPTYTLMSSESRGNVLERDNTGYDDDEKY